MSLASERVDPQQAVGNIVTAVLGDLVGTPIHGTGRVISYSTDPTFLIEAPDGTRYSWRASWCRHPTDTELQEIVKQLMAARR